MTFLRPLHVVATVAVLAVVGMGCTVEDDGGSFSASQTLSQSGGETSSGSGGSGGTTAVASVGTTAEAVSSTGEPGTTVEPGTTGNPTTSGDPTTGSATTGEATTEAGTTGNPIMCGDGVISGNEQCDKSNLNGFTCEALGNMGGELLCDPMTCTFDTQMCDVGGGDTSGGTSG